MHLTKEHLGLLKDIQNEWNCAEQDIKLAENVVNKIVIPSVKELRYAGRRIVDAIMVISDNPECPDQVKLTNLLADARFDCHRARHDAIDAATAKIAADFEIMTKMLGYGPILGAFPKFPELYSALTKVRRNIVNSRGDRENREKIYSVLEQCDFRALVVMFEDLRMCEPMMLALAKKERAISFWGKVGGAVGIIGLLVGIGGVLIALLK